MIKLQKRPRILLLGGTRDGRKLAERLHQQGYEVVYSIAGLVRRPDLPCTVISGGFSGFARRFSADAADSKEASVAGLACFLQHEGIDLLLDVTHPYAQNMSAHAVPAARALQLPCWRLHRSPWQPEAGDNWRSFDSWTQLMCAVSAFVTEQSQKAAGKEPGAEPVGILFSVGQLDTQQLVQLTELSEGFNNLRHPPKILLRSAAEHRLPLPESVHWLKAIGPFSEADEAALFEQHNIGLVISKNSGGAATRAKLAVARQRGCAVFLQQRPGLPGATRAFTQPAALIAALGQHFDLDSGSFLLPATGFALTDTASERTDSCAALSVDDLSADVHLSADAEHLLSAYIPDPVAIEQESFRQIRQLTDLSGYSTEQQQVVMRIVHSVGMPEVAAQVRFSDNACEQGLAALKKQAPILCDVEMVRQGLTKRMLATEPLCFLNRPETQARAQQQGETRTMAALELWRPHLKGSVVLIGNAPTALFRLLEMIRDGAEKPALIIGMPVGFVGAAESKQALWQLHRKLGIECITLLGRAGGSAVTSASCNALLRCLRGELY